jgi:hypothetical protein
MRHGQYDRPGTSGGQRLGMPIGSGDDLLDDDTASRYLLAFREPQCQSRRRGAQLVRDSPDCALLNKSCFAKRSQRVGALPKRPGFNQ